MAGLYSDHFRFVAPFVSVQVAASPSIGPVWSGPQNRVSI
jgi:hypothetical protein